MKYLRLALLVLASALTLARAQQQQDDEEKQKPPIEIPDFSNLDEYIYEPKSTVLLSFRHLSGIKTEFFGGGSVPAPEGLPALTGINIARIYHDGNVLPDSRSVGRVDGSGNPGLDPTSGVIIFDPIAPDGKTNSWSYNDVRQNDSTHAPIGYMSFHTYSADVTDTAIRRDKGTSTNGLDLAMTRDMGKFFGGRVSWNIVAGMSVNDISAKKLDDVAANVTTLNDLYSTFGSSVPVPPYQAPSTTTQNVLDANGNTVVSSAGVVQTETIDTSVLISSQPVYRYYSNLATQAGVAGATIQVQDNWRLKGAYYTFRVGPELVIPLGRHFKFTVSAGPVVVYSGTTYTVIQTLTPEIGPDITVTDVNEANKIRPGYFADATLEYNMTDKAGFFAGAVFQSAGSYTQTLNSDTAHYNAKIDLSNQNGVRAGMSVRF